MQRNQGYQNAYGSGSMKDLAKGSSNNANGFNGQATQSQNRDEIDVRISPRRGGQKRSRSPLR